MVTGLHQICKFGEKLTGYWNKARVNSNVHREQNNYERGQAGISLSSFDVEHLVYHDNMIRREKECRQKKSI